MALDPPSRGLLVPRVTPGRTTEPNGEADNRAGSEMLLARIAAAENRGMPPIRKLEDPELRFRMHQPEAENMLVEMRQFTAAVGVKSNETQVSAVS